MKPATKKFSKSSSQKGGAAATATKRYASTEKRGPSEYKKEWSRFMTHVDRERTDKGRSTSAASPSTGSAASAAANEKTKLKKALDIQDDILDGGSTFSYLFHSKSVTSKVSQKKQEAAKLKQMEENRKKKLLNVAKEKQREKEIAEKKRLREEAKLKRQEELKKLIQLSGKRRERDEFDEFDEKEDEEDVVDEEEQQQLTNSKNEEDSDEEEKQNQHDDDDEEDDEDEEEKSKMEKALLAAQTKGVSLEGMNRKQKRQLLQLTRNAAAEKVEEQRKKITAKDLMDPKLQWYQQGPFPLDEITEKLVNKNALKHVKTMPELKLHKYNYQLIHPSWLAARQRKRFESMHALHEGTRTVFKDEEN
jgi:hypothetical protein